MLRIILGLFFLTSCASGIYTKGGEERYVYRPQDEYTFDQLKELAPQIITTSRRDTHQAKVDDLFQPGMKDLKRVAIVVFESVIQPTRGGLAGQNKIYLSAQGKQLLTEKLLSVWEQGIKIIDPELDYVSSSQLKKKSSVFREWGLEVDDHVKVKRTSVAPDDIFYLEGGKETTLYSTMNPRGMRDLSLFLVPAYEIMAGPKWSEHAKHFINDLSKELNLDAIIIVMSEISWSSAHIDKHSGENFAEEAKINLKSSVLIPLTQYHQRLKALGKNDKPNLTVCYRAYETELKIPLRIDLPNEQQNFETIEKEVLGPVLKTYNEMSQMMLIQLTQDLKATH